ncbi:hypothetical protein NQ314_021252 [Rhamnusium bicolor]|uniref:Uncharacterized protein n=1 Tax=Rhamnusium bicolor TaxID=1586634 RepID=A0AAV8WJ26_9CUCU|nr:hypothetical protein NQ314_021252 [Rhamnusium bicolor]
MKGYNCNSENSDIIIKVTEINLFSRLSLNEKLEIKNSGRPTPVSNIVQEQRKYNNKNAFKRKFDKSIYNKTIWICS